VSDPVNVIYGTFILFVGWISFNCSGTYGLTGGREHLAARVGVVTMMGGAAGTLAGLLQSNVATAGKSFEIEPASIGALAGLVSITAACANIGIWEGALAGFTGGLLACFSRGTLLDFLQLDDPVGAIPVHLVGGVWGLIVPALFNRADGFGPATLPGWVHGGGGELLAVQLVGVVALSAWGAVGTLLVLLVMGRCMALRVTKEQEKLGLDVVEHGILAATRAPNSAPKVRASDHRIVQRIREGVLRRGRPGLRRNEPHRADGSHHGRHVHGEFVEDVGHAAKVSAVVRSFAFTLRQRAVSRHPQAEESSQRQASNEIVVVSVGGGA